MPFRTTPIDVQSICAKIDLSKVESYIRTANLIVNNNIVGACGANYDPCTLKMIETWLTAHFWAQDNPLLVEKKIGEAENIYGQRGDYRGGYASTPYGRTAMTLDWAGCLASQELLNKNGGARVVGVVYGGTNPHNRRRSTGPTSFPNTGPSNRSNS